jgi:hypothetical protein
MSWRTITESDLKTALSNTELETLRRALGADAEDTVASTLQLLASEIRDYIATGGTDLDATAYTLPEGLIGRAVQIAIVRLSTRAGGILPDPKGLRAKAAESAEKFFADKVAEGKHAIEEPTTPATAALSNKPAGPSLTTKTLHLQKDDQDGV